MDDGYLSNYSLAYPILKKLNIPATIFLTTSFVNQKEFLWMDRVEYALALARPNHYRLNVHDQKLLLDLRNDDLKLKSLKKIKSLIKSEPQGLRLKFIAELESLLKNKLTLNEKTPEIYLPLDWHQVQKMVEKELVSIGGHTHTHAILTKCSPKELKKELSLAKKIIEKNIKIKLLPFAYPNGTVKDFNKQIQSYLKQLNYSCALTTMSGFNNKKTDLFELRRIAVDDRMDWIEFIMNISGFRYLLLRLLKI
ncbi:MAG: polysaccharide deacetylase family protein [Nanoarchaeota archaeon]|nr:polysaccharide deacetylase family protein [Nanoarchaeota archaeon]